MGQLVWLKSVENCSHIKETWWRIKKISTSHFVIKNLFILYLHKLLMLLFWTYNLNLVFQILSNIFVYNKLNCQSFWFFSTEIGIRFFFVDRRSLVLILNDFKFKRYTGFNFPRMEVGMCGLPFYSFFLKMIK